MYPGVRQGHELPQAANPALQELGPRRTPRGVAGAAQREKNNKKQGKNKGMCSTQTQYTTHYPAASLAGETPASALGSEHLLVGT